MDLGLYQLKYPLRRLIRGVLPPLRNVHPDVVSWSILPVGIATAICFRGADRHRYLLIAGSVLILLRMFLATLDGLMAVTFNKSSRRGELANRIPAEISDVLLLLALALQTGHGLPGLIALAIAWLITFTGLVGLTADSGTQSVGPAGSTDRLTAVILFSLGQYIARVVGHPLDLLGYFLWWVCLGGSLTIALRIWRTYRSVGSGQPTVKP